jgi:hypothetical protein
MVPSLVLVVTPPRLFWGPPEKSPHRRDRGRCRPKKLSRDCQKPSIFIFGNRTKRVIIRLDIARAEPKPSIPAARRLRQVQSRQCGSSASRLPIVCKWIVPIAGCGIRPNSALGTWKSALRTSLTPSGHSSAILDTPREFCTSRRRLGASARIGPRHGGPKKMSVRAMADQSRRRSAQWRTKEDIFSEPCGTVHFGRIPGLEARGCFRRRKPNSARQTRSLADRGAPASWRPGNCWLRP